MAPVQKNLDEIGLFQICLVLVILDTTFLEKKLSAWKTEWYCWVWKCTSAVLVTCGYIFRRTMWLMLDDFPLS